MDTKILTSESILNFQKHLNMEEKSAATVAKYVRDCRAFFIFAGEQPISKLLVMQYKQSMIEKGYAVKSINSMLASLNSLLNFLGWEECKVKNIRSQRQIYCEEKRELSKEEYIRLLKAAKNNPRIELILQTICGTGIRVSELVYFTVENVNQGAINVSCKNKIRTILIPTALKKLLLKYAKKNKIKSGVIFRTKSGKAMNRSNIWAQMKRLAKEAGVLPSKVFPHNLRKLFAKTFYKAEKDIAKLADILGHRSINTTRIYIMTSGTEHRKKIEKLGLVIEDENEKGHNLHNVV